ncbi:c-type cytochrome [Photobacterium nomapromontoriensis]|uniref:c-type cytochrome n=1 Tax=Photobacterium nomapromontoriensis TaxID=2910237 RepID=UPI003D0ED407
MKKNQLLLLSLLLSSPSFADIPKGDANAGKIKAFSCQFCHGQAGVASQDGYPHVNGQNPLYLFNAMKAYQNSERQGNYADMMKQQLSVFNNQDLADIASFYSQLP